MNIRVRELESEMDGWKEQNTESRNAASEPEPEICELLSLRRLLSLPVIPPFLFSRLIKVMKSDIRM
jgi:hypothetical protein